MNAELKVRCSHTEKLLWEQTAIGLGYTLSMWVRASLNSLAEHVLEEGRQAHRAAGDLVGEPPAEQDAFTSGAPTVVEAAVPAAEPPSPTRVDVLDGLRGVIAKVPSGKSPYKPPTYK